jgi:DNA-binding LacI/PurR family transcriptional regulator
MVLIDLESDSKNTIYTDNYLSTRKAVKYLIDKGHKKIAYVKGDLYRYIGKERYNGYVDEMKANNIPVEEKYLFNAPHYTTEEGYSVAGEISLLDDYPTAVVCPADVVAIGVIDGLSNLKIKVPEQVSVIGFDDIKLSSFITPKLTTIAQDKKQIGFLAVKTLIDNINNDKFKTKHYKIEGILIERNSVKEL